jgi:hypothetical protein
MSNIYRNLILVALSSFSLVSCNISTYSQSAKIQNAIENSKIKSLSRSYNKCIDDGKKFDALASSRKDAANSLYNKSAKILTDCENLIKENAYIINESERMKNYALTIQNYIKAGNLIQASINFKDFQNTFNNDLVYEDGSSFTENIESLLGYKDANISGKFALINNSKIIRTELKRINHWSKN